MTRIEVAIVGPKFVMGKIAWSADVNEAMAEEEDGEFAKFCAHSLARHAKGDWGIVSNMDKKLNDRALKEGTRLFSAYQEAPFRKIWIITEADRSVTTVIFPEEY